MHRIDYEDNLLNVRTSIVLTLEEYFATAPLPGGRAGVWAALGRSRARRLSYYENDPPFGLGDGPLCSLPGISGETRAITIHYALKQLLPHSYTVTKIAPAFELGLV